MIARGFYRVPASVFADAGEDTKTPADFGCIVLATHTTNFYLHSHINPNEALEEAGGVLLDNWPALKAAVSAPVRNKIFHKRVRREVTIDGETVTWPPHKFLGDPDPEPVP